MCVGVEVAKYVHIYMVYEESNCLVVSTTPDINSTLSVTQEIAFTKWFFYMRKGQSFN